MHLRRFMPDMGTALGYRRPQPQPSVHDRPSSPFTVGTPWLRAAAARRPPVSIEALFAYPGYLLIGSQSGLTLTVGGASEAYLPSPYTTLLFRIGAHDDKLHAKPGRCRL